MSPSEGAAVSAITPSLAGYGSCNKNSKQAKPVQISGWWHSASSTYWNGGFLAAGHGPRPAPLPSRSRVSTLKQGIAKGTPGRPHDEHPWRPHPMSTPAPRTASPTRRGAQAAAFIDAGQGTGVLRDDVELAFQHHPPGPISLGDQAVTHLQTCLLEGVRRNRHLVLGADAAGSPLASVLYSGSHGKDNARLTLASPWPPCRSQSANYDPTVGSVGPGELVIVLVLLVPLGVTVFAIVDGARRPEWAWQQAGQNKALWIALQAVGIFFCALGVIMSIIYLAAIRPKLILAEGA